MKSRQWTTKRLLASDHGSVQIDSVVSVLLARGKKSVVAVPFAPGNGKLRLSVTWDGRTRKVQLAVLPARQREGVRLFVTRGSGPCQELRIRDEKCEWLLPGDVEQCLESEPEARWYLFAVPKHAAS